MNDDWIYETRSPFWLRWPIIATGLVAVCVAVGGGYATLRGAAPAAASTPTAVTARCVTEENRLYKENHPATIGPQTWAVLVPKICAAGVAEGAVSWGGWSSKQVEQTTSADVIKRFGVARMQTLAFNELALSRYHLARAGHVTRRERCLAMGYSGYDGLTSAQQADYPPRATMVAAVHYACALGL